VRYIVLSILIVLISLESCQKASPSAPNISGNWNWFATYYDNILDSTNPRTPQNSNTTELVSFNGNNYTIKKGNQIVASGTYSTNVITNPFGELANCIHYKKGTSDSITYYEISHDTLCFSNDLGGSVGSSPKWYIRVR